MNYLKPAAGIGLHNVRTKSWPVLCRLQFIMSSCWCSCNSYYLHSASANTSVCRLCGSLFPKGFPESRNPISSIQICLMIASNAPNAGHIKFLECADIMGKGRQSEALLKIRRDKKKRLQITNYTVVWELLRAALRIHSVRFPPTHFSVNRRDPCFQEAFSF